MSRFKSLAFLRIFFAILFLRTSETAASRTVLAVGLVPLLALIGCAAVQVRLGTRVYLEKTPVTSMDVKLAQAKQAKGPGIAPGEKLPLIAMFVGPDGKVLATEGEGHGKILWKDLKVTATVATVNGKGIVSLPKDPRISDGKVPHITVSAPSHPDLHAELDIPLRYDHNYTASYSGSSGFSGMDGSAGMDGSSGSMGSVDPDHPSPGGDGGNGTDGGDGSDGKPGLDGPPVQIRMAFRSGDHPLLQVSVSAEGKQKLYLLDPQGGSLAVSSVGGSGGSGGRGGRGGRGGAGGIGSPNGNSGRDGSNGRDGLSGSPGNGGSITVTYDPQAKPFLSTLKLSNPGGPRPAFIEQPVAPLW